MIYSKRMLMSAACLLAVAKGVVPRVQIRAGDHHKAMRDGLQSVRSMGSVGSVRSPFQRADSEFSLLDEKEQQDWFTLVENAEAKFLMLDLDQAILHRVSGADATSSNQVSKFVTKQVARDRKTAFETANKGTKAFIVSKLPVGTDQDRADEEEETWLLVALRPGIMRAIRDAKRKGWFVGINTAMSPVHGQPIVEHLETEFGFTIPKELRFFRTSTCRDPERAPKASRNIKDYDRPTWLTQLNFNKGKWYYQYQNSKPNRDGSISWTNLKLNETELGALCPEVVDGTVDYAIQDNLAASIITDELQRLYEDTNGFYSQVMGALGKGKMDPKIYKTEPRTDFDTPLFTNKMQTIHMQTISERLTAYARKQLGHRVVPVIVHFDDKAHDVRFDNQVHEETNRLTDAWYPQTSEKVGDKTRVDYANDINELRSQLGLDEDDYFVEAEEKNQRADDYYEEYGTTLDAGVITTILNFVGLA